MLKRLKAAAAAAILAVASLPTSAAIFVFSNEFSGAQNCANVLTVTGCATLEVTANLTGGVDFLLTGNLADGEHIKEISGNEFPFSLLTTDFDFSGTGATVVDKVVIKEDGLKADGDGHFDWTIEFKSSPRFILTDTLSWTIANTTIDAIIGATSVGGPAGKNGFVFAIHAGGFANDGSGWFNGVPGNGGGGQELSAPGVLSLLGLGLLMAGFVRRRGSMA